MNGEIDATPKASGQSNEPTTDPVGAPVAGTMTGAEVGPSSTPDPTAGSSAHPTFKPPTAFGLEASARPATDPAFVLSAVIATLLLPIAVVAMTVFVRAPTSLIDYVIEVPISWLGLASIAHLLRKRRAVQTDRRLSHHIYDRVMPEILRAVLPARGADMVRAVRDGARALSPKSARSNLLIRRMELSIAGKQPAQVASSALQLPPERDQRELEAAYGGVRFMIWAMPILGFIGTVAGISGAIGAFSSAMSAVDAPSEITNALKIHLPVVTQNLSTAFDTTFLGLFYSLWATLIFTWVARQDEEYLIELDGWWFSTIGPALAGQATSSGTEGTGVREVAAELENLAKHIGALHLVVEHLHARESLGGVANAAPGAPRAPRAVPSGARVDGEM